MTRKTVELQFPVISMKFHYLFTRTKKPATPQQYKSLERAVRSQITPLTERVGRHMDADDAELQPLALQINDHQKYTAKQNDVIYARWTSVRGRSAHAERR